MALEVYVDGGSRGNPGPAGAGIVIVRDNGERLYEAGHFLGRATNNVAEYSALLEALRRVQTYAGEPVQIYSDSELLVRQITGEYRVKSEALAPLHEEAQLLLLRLACWSIKHVPRELNRRADELANLAMDSRETVVVFDAARPGAQRADAQPAPTEKPQPAPVAPPSDVSEAASSAAAPGDGSRAILLEPSRPPRAATCPAGAWLSAPIAVAQTLPPGICLHAAYAILPTLLALHSLPVEEFAALPVMTLRCNRGGCTAVFRVTGRPHGNGAGGVHP